MNSNREPDGTAWRPLYVVAFVLIVIQVLAGLAIWFWIDNWNDRASFGDMFGVVNTFFSGLALAGVIYAIFLQQNELQLQRRELELARNELHRAAQAEEENVRLSALSFFPAVTIELYHDDVSVPVGQFKAIRLDILNVGHLPAYDLEIRLLGIYGRNNAYSVSGSLVTSENGELVGKLEEGVISEDRLKQLADVGKDFVLCQTVYHPMFPHMKGFRSILTLPPLADSVKLLIQLRDVQGNNYCQLYVYSTGQDSAFGLSLHSLEPKAPVFADRVLFDNQTVTMLEPPADLLGRAFADDWNRSSPVYPISNVRSSAQIRDEWYEI